MLEALWNLAVFGLIGWGITGWALHYRRKRRNNHVNH